jgi:WD40 repeat protein
MAFDRLGALEGDLELWGSCARFDRWRRWTELPPAAGAEVQTLRGLRGDIHAVSFFPGGHAVAAAGSGRALGLWRTDSGKELAHHRLEKVVWDLAIHPEQRLMVLSREREDAAGDKLELFIFDGVQFRPHAVDRSSQRIRDVAWSSDGRRFAAVFQEGMCVKVFDLDDLGSPQVLKHPASSGLDLKRLCFSANGSRVAALARDRICLWDVESGELVGTPFAPGLGEFCPDIRFSPDGKRLFATNSLLTINEWDLVGGQQSNRTVEGEFKTSDHYFAIDWSPDQRLLAAGGENGEILVVDMEKLEHVHTFSGHWARLDSIAFSADGKLLASGGQDTTVKIWDVSPLLR